MLLCHGLLIVLCTPHFQDARVRIFHGDELVLAITPEGEELGFVRASRRSFREARLATASDLTANLDSTQQHGTARDSKGPPWPFVN